MKLDVGDILQIPVTRLALGGDSIGTLPDGRVCFVRGAPITEKCQVRLIKVKKRFVRGELLTRIESPHCGSASKCGGCPWHFAEAEIQNQSLLQHAIRSLSRLQWQHEVHDIAWGALSEKEGWRRTIRWRWEGKQLGLLKWGTHQIVDALSCSILMPTLESVRLQLREAFRKSGVGTGVLKASLGADNQVYLSAQLDDQLELNEAQVRSFLEFLVREIDDLGGVECTHDARVIFEWGAHTYPVGADQVPHHISGFVQANASIHDDFVTYVTEQFPQGSHVLELFCGAGIFTHRLLQRGCSVVAIEGSRTACATLSKSAESWISDGALTVRNERIGAMPKGEGDYCLLDPPRAGIKTLLSHLKPNQFQRIVYVACDFGTLCRDLEGLNRIGYRIEAARLFDMFPNSGHVECVVTLV
ncbi:MAG: class I SAM-dependent RNA methyltransferase [Bradymonadia bacterium]